MFYDALVDLGLESLDLALVILMHFLDLCLLFLISSSKHLFEKFILPFVLIRARIIISLLNTSEFLSEVLHLCVLFFDDAIEPLAHLLVLVPERCDLRLHVVHDGFDLFQLGLERILDIVSNEHVILPEVALESRRLEVGDVGTIFMSMGV